MNNVISVRNIYRRSQNGAPTEPEPTLYTLFGSNLIWGPDVSYFKNMLQESPLDGSDPTARTAVTVAGDSVGTLYDTSDHALLTVSANNSRRPTIVTKVGSDAWLRFSDAGTDQYMVVTNSRQIFAPIVAASPIWTLAFEIDFSNMVNGTQYVIFDSRTSTGSQTGFTVLRTTGNNLLVGASVAGGGNKINFTSTGTVNAAAGKKIIRIQVNGTGASAGSLFIGNSAAETFSVSAGTDGVLCTNDLQIGMIIGGTNTGLNAEIRKIVLTKHVWSAGEVTTYTAYDPQINTTKEIYRVFRRIDTSDNSLMFQDTAASVSVADNDRVRIVKTTNRSLWGTGNELRRDWIAPAFYVDLSGTNGSCTITVNGTVLTATFATSLYQTSVNFRTNGTNATNLVSLGLIVYEQSNTFPTDTQQGRINFYADRAGIAVDSWTVSIANVTGNLTGTKFDTKRAVYDADGYNGISGALKFAKADWTNFEMQDLGIELMGKRTFGYLLKYVPILDNAEVGHFLIGTISGTGRDLITGPAYSGNAVIPGATGVGYNVWHGSSSVFGNGPVLPLQWNKIVHQVNGVTVTTYVNGVLVDTATMNTNCQLKVARRGMAQAGDQIISSTNNWQGWMGNSIEIQGICPISYINTLLDS